jgi:hypothetical protein
LFQLIAIANLDDQPEEAIEYCQALLAPSQMRLPDPLEEALTNAIIDWEAKDTEETLAQFNQAVNLAKEYGYL